MKALPVKCRLEVIVLSAGLPFPPLFLFNLQRYDVGTSGESAQGRLVGSISHDSIVT